MILELNNVVLTNCGHNLSMIARSGQMTCLTGNASSHYLMAVLGLEPIVQGYVSIDGEPLEPDTAHELRMLMAYAPARLSAEGQICIYEPPTVQDVFSLKANRHVPISNGILSEEIRRAGSAELVAVSALLNRPILLAETPPVAAADYLLAQADNGCVVVVASDATAYTERAHLTVNCALMPERS